jgi:GDP-4-dehydro-6-deoxy-D-mannose reductase
MILVTGDTGFIGRHLVAHLVEAGKIVHGLSRRRNDENCDRERVDICDGERVYEALAERRPAAIYHLAGPSFVPGSRRDPAAFWKTHVTGTLNLLEAVRAIGEPWPRILLAGTADSYRPDPARLPFDEETPIEPENPYAAAKLAQESLGIGWHRAYGMPIVRVRLFNVIGPGQGDRFVASNFAMQAARVKLGLQPPRIETGDLRTARDFVDWRDAVEALERALTRGEPGAVYNVASGTARPIGEILEYCVGRAGVPVEIVQPKSLARPGQAMTRYGSAARLTEQTGWRPRRLFTDTLDAIYDDWYRRLGGRSSKPRRAEHWVEPAGWQSVDEFKVIYFDPEMEDSDDFDTGCAYGCTDAGAATGPEFYVDHYLHAALFNLECGERVLVDEFNRFSPNPGWGHNESPILRHRGIRAAASTLRRAAEIAEDEVDLLVAIQSPDMQYRIKCPASEMRTRLLNLANFLDWVHREGNDVQFHI